MKAQPLNKTYSNQIILYNVFKNEEKIGFKYGKTIYVIICRFFCFHAVVQSYYGPGGPGPPQYLAQTIVKVGFGPPQYLRQKGSKTILEAWGPPKTKSMTTALLNIHTHFLPVLLFGSILQILSGLYIGNFRDSKDLKQLDLHKITHILSIHDDARKLFKVRNQHIVAFITLLTYCIAEIL